MTTNGTPAVAVVAEQCLAPVPGGTGRYTRDLVAALVRTAPPGSEVETWVAWHRDIAGAGVPGARGPYRLGLPRRPLTAAWERGVGPRPRRATVVHAPTPLFPPSRVPLVVTVHDAVPWTHPETLTARGVAFHRRMVERAARLAEIIVVPTAAVRAELGLLLPAAHRFEVVPPAMSPDLVVPPDATARVRALDLDPARGFLLTVATVEPRKGLDLLIEALGRGGGAGLPLAVVGPAGWGDVDPQALAIRAGLPAERLRLIGRVADPDLAALYSAATAVVAPSRAEGFGLPVLEAMTLGVPVVATRIPALVEVAGGAARLVEPDADDLRAGIDAVVGDPALRAAMVRAGLVRAADFDWDRTGHRLWTLYAEMTGNFRPS